MDLLREYNNYYIIPFIKYPKITGGICGKNGKFVVDSLRWPTQSVCDHTFRGNLQSKKINTLNKSVIFMGHLTCHYGHFLLETLSRFWIFCKLNKSFFDDKEIVFLDFVHNPVDINKIAKYNVINYVFKTLDIKNYSFRKIKSVSRVKKLYLPEILNPTDLNLNKIIADYQKKLFNSICKNIVPKFDDIKIYITRKKKDETDCRPSSKYDNMFKSLGFIILYPTSASFEKDLYYYKSARIIAGIDGTGLHNIGFMENPKGYMIELHHRSKTFLDKYNGLATGQYFFNFFNHVPYTVIRCFSKENQYLTVDKVKQKIKDILVSIDC